MTTVPIVAMLLQSDVVSAVATNPDTLKILGGIAMHALYSARAFGRLEATMSSHSERLQRLESINDNK